MPVGELTKTRVWLRHGNSYPDASLTPWPLATLQADSGALQVGLPWRKFVFPRKSVIRLLRYPPLFGKFGGFQIEHTLLEQPNTMIVWTHKFEELKAHLEKSGYPLSN